jgi:hypothetical protein
MFAKRKDACFPFGCADAVTRQQWTDDGAAMSMKLTRGCGRLGAPSPGPTWGACPSSRLRGSLRTRMLLRLGAKPGASGSQDGSRMPVIPTRSRSKGWYISVCSMMRMLYTIIYCYTSMQSLPNSFPAYFFSLHFWLQDSDRLCCAWRIMM